MHYLAEQGISRTAIREENDYYATDPRAMEELLEFESFDRKIWEPACGEGNLAEVLKKHGHEVYSTDLIDRGYQDELLNFLESERKFDGDIITNPPFKYAKEFVLKSLESVNDGQKVAMFLKLNYLAGVARYKEIYQKTPPVRIYVFSNKRSCSKNNTKEGFKKRVMDYAWFIWEKGQPGPCELKWICKKKRG